MHKTAVRSQLLFIQITHWFMVVAGFIHSDTMESVTRTALGLCSMITDLRGALIKSATSRSTFHLSIQGTGLFALSVKTTTTTLKKCWFVDRIVYQSSWLFTFIKMSISVLIQKMKLKSIINFQISYLMAINIRSVLKPLHTREDLIKHVIQLETAESWWFGTSLSGPSAVNLVRCSLLGGMMVDNLGYQL